MSSYAIIQRARVGRGRGITHLALVDRAKSKRLWWTSDNIGIAICYESRDAANFAASRLHYNGARVVPWDEAVKLINEQDGDIMFHEAMSDSELGWDGHKAAW